MGLGWGRQIVIREKFVLLSITISLFCLFSCVLVLGINPQFVKFMDDEV